MEHSICKKSHERLTNMKNNLFIKSLFIAVIGFSLSYVFYQFSGNSLNKHHRDEIHLNNWLNIGYKTITQNVSFENIDTVEINTLTADTNIQLSKSNIGKVNLTTNSKQNNSISTIKKIDKILIISIANDKESPYSSINIQLPNTVKNLKVNTLSGDVNIEKIKLDKIDIHTMSGDIRLDHVMSTNAIFKSTSGDVVWSGAGKTIEIETVTGDITFDSLSPITGNINANSVNGNVVIPKEFTIGSNQINLKSVNGDITINVKNN